MASEPHAQSPSGTQALAVELRGLAKTYGACVSNRDVTLQVRAGTIHALVGENGAGKSTAMKMLYGMVKPDSGKIIVHGEERVWRSPRDAVRAGIGMVHQHFMLSGSHSGLDNILLGAEPLAGRRWLPLPGMLRRIDRQGALARLQQLAAAHHLPVDLTVPVGQLPVGMQQRLEILKLLYRDVGILILDEPTAVLTPQEADELFANLSRLRGQGKTVIIITHKLREVLGHTDAVTVLRRGEVVGTVATQLTNEADLAAMMVGRAVRLTVAAPPVAAHAVGQESVPALRLGAVHLARRSHKPVLGGLDLVLAPGEIVGIAGIEGNGQNELLQLLLSPRPFFHTRGGLTGQKLRASGRCEILGHDVRGMTPRAVRSLGVGLVPEDRHRQGLLLPFTLAENFLLGQERSPALARYGWIRSRALRAAVGAAIQAFDIRPPDPTAAAASLSGGNQQKLIMARELSRAPRLLICAQPTRGVDVGSIEFIHAELMAARAAGCAVLLISSSLDEILALSDRIAVLYEGRFTAFFARGEADEATIGRYMAGGRHAAAT